MNWLDAVIIIIAIVLGFTGMKRGIIKTVFGIAGLVVGIVLAGRYYDNFANLFSSFDVAWAGIAAYAIILLATMALVGWIGSQISKLLKTLMLGWIDGLVGGLIGILMGGVFCAAIFTIVLKYNIGGPFEDIVLKSQLAILLMDRFPLLLGLLPGGDLSDVIRSIFQ
jgi:membrane protein required for colicin V production